MRTSWRKLKPLRNTLGKETDNQVKTKDGLRVVDGRTRTHLQTYLRKVCKTDNEIVEAFNATISFLAALTDEDDYENAIASGWGTLIWEHVYAEAG